MKTPATFKQIDLQRAVRALRAEGIDAFEIVLTAGGAKLVAQSGPKPESAPRDDTWDDLKDAS
jgi:hypothetical protein